MLKETSKDRRHNILLQKRAGLLVPLFCVYSKKSAGIGDFEDLKLLIDFICASGNSILQLLPMNETGSTFCPYDSISSFALEPMYICLSELCAEKPALSSKLNRIRKDFPAGRKHLDYSLKEAKLNFLKEIFSGSALDKNRSFHEFRRQNKYWIEDFALFKVLKQNFGNKPWYEWPDQYRLRAQKALSAFKDKNRRELDFQVWMQWLAYRQFKAAKEYALKKNVFLNGDMPILVSRDSADVWQFPQFFKMEFAAGAPPDMYCAKGQRWGMPTYNWQAIEDDGFTYLKRKLSFTENLFDIIRVDHIVGLFRIWSIPYNDSPENQGLNGKFDPRDENLWPAHGRRILSEMLSSTKMLVCGEDLGMIPPACPQAMQEFGIPGNDVQRWVKDWQVKHDFLKPEEYRRLSVATLSTHDTTNWPAWWENEAGTIDEALFVRKCAEKGIDYNSAVRSLFDCLLSRHGRLRWKKEINSLDALVRVLAQDKNLIRDIIEIYENTYAEKEKFWKQAGLSGKMQEACVPKALEAAFRIVLKSSSVFCINSIFDWLLLGGILKGDPYDYRINTPGTVSRVNWSLTAGIPLEELVKHKMVKKMKELIKSSGRK